MENASVVGKQSSDKAKENCGCSTTSENIHTACSILGNTTAGLGIGVAAALSLVVAAAAAEVAVPAILVLKALGLTGGAIGFLKGIKKDD